MHVPVLLNEMLQAIKPSPGCVYLDGTLGAGGYSEAILSNSEPDGQVVALDLDPGAVVRAAKRLEAFGSRFRAVHGGFQDSPGILGSLGIEKIDGAVLDLGLSSDQLGDPRRGFSFQSEGPLDMRFDTSSALRLSDLLDSLSVAELEEIIAKFGEERYYSKVARGLVNEKNRRALSTTRDLARVIERAIGRGRSKIHPATRTFQALRIALNRELDNLETALDLIPLMLRPGGRLCVVSYHSLEDRMVKLSFRERKKDPRKWAVLTPKPVRPSPEETAANPRSRSARMRVLEAVV